MNLKPCTIDGHYYRYGECEKYIDELVRTEPQMAAAFIEPFGRKEDIYFAKKLLAVPPPISVEALRSIYIGYSIRSQREQDPDRINHYWERSIEYLKRYIALSPDNLLSRSLLLEKLFIKLLEQAIGITYKEWVERGYPQAAKEAAVDQQLVFDFVHALVDLGSTNSILKIEATYLEFVMGVNRREETTAFAVKKFSEQMAKYRDTPGEGAHSIKAFLERHKSGV